MSTSVIRNEQRKLLATAVNNLGVAIVVTGVVAPTVGYFYGTLLVADPLRLVSLTSIYAIVGGLVLVNARAIMGGLE